MRVIVAVLAIVAMGCGASVTGPSLELSPQGWFKLDPGDYGTLSAEHGPLADARWVQVSDCLGLHYTPHAFTIRFRANAGGPQIGYFMSDGQMVGGKYHPYHSVEVLGDPGWRWVSSWKHEFMHYLLDMTTGDPDIAHRRGGLEQYSVDADGHPLFMGADWLRCAQ